MKNSWADGVCQSVSLSVQAFSLIASERPVRSGPECQRSPVCAADAKLAGYMYAIPAYMVLWLPFVWGAGCARQDRKSLFERGPPVLGNFELLTPNFVH